jgi:Xaa-Pro dipeptidase
MSVAAEARTEYESRLGRTRERMSEAGLDALIVTRPENIFYLTNYRAAHIAARTTELHAAVIPRQGEPRIMTRAVEKLTVRTQWTADPRLFKDHENPYAILVNILEESGSEAGTIGIEERFLTFSQYKKIRAALPGATFNDITGMVESLTAQPSSAELECMRRAAKITSVGLETGMREVGAGVYPYEIIGKVHDAMFAAGQSDFDLSVVSVWSGPDGGRIHDTRADEVINAGDLVTVQIMGVDNHYKAGSQACAFVGEDAPADIAEAYQLVVEMYTRAKEAVRAGVTAGDVFEAANAVYRAARGTDYYRRVGGSIGLTNWAIDLVKDSDVVLTAGVSLLIQTLVDDPALLTYSSTVIVTEDGYEELTQPRRGLTLP